MRYSVAQLLQEHTGAVRHNTLLEDVTGLDPDIQPVEPLTGPIVLMRTVDGILVTGHLNTVIQMECSRCLESVVVPVELELEEDFTPTIDVLTGHRLPIPADADAATLIDEHHILDLTEVIRQNMLLAQPARSLCRRDCLGLCPICGQNLNEGPCSCEASETDSRWAGLAEWKD